MGQTLSERAPLGGGEDLTYDAATRTLSNNAGDSVVLPEATGTDPGLMSAADKTALDAAVAAVALIDDPAEIKAALDAIADTNLLTDAERASIAASAAAVVTAQAAADAAQADADTANAAIAALPADLVEESDFAAALWAFLIDATGAKLAAALTSRFQQTALGGGNWKIGYTNGSGEFTELALGAAGTALVGNGAAAAPSFANTWRRIFKTADETISADDVLGADAALTVALEASTTYILRGWVLFNAANATMDIKFDLNYDGTLSGDISSHLRFMVAGVTAGTDAETVGISNAAVGSTPVTGATSGRGRIFFEQTFTTNAAGTFSFRWAQNTSDAGNLSVLKGSYLEYIKVA